MSTQISKKRKLSWGRIEKVFLYFKGGRAGIIKALTTDVDEFYRQCDPEKGVLCLYGFPSEKWRLKIPAQDVPTDLPEPTLGINFARDGMQENEWLSLVAVHSDVWLLSVAFSFGATFSFDKTARKFLFNMINDLPTIFEVVSGVSKKQTNEKSPVSNDSSNKSNSKSNAKVLETFSFIINPPKNETLSCYPHTKVEEVFCDFKDRRAGIIKALTTDVEEFYQQCDPENENLCLYGFPSEQWEVNLPAQKVPSELPQPTVGINFVRDEMREKDWLSLVAKHSDVWLLSVAFCFGARLLFDKADRNRLFNMINNLPTIFEVMSGAAKKQTKEKSPVSSDSSNKSKSNSKDFKGSRAGIIKALTTDVEELYRQCDPENGDLCLYGFPSEKWKVKLPAIEVPLDLPEPTLGINFARDEMQEKEWLSLVAVHSDMWLLSVAFCYGTWFSFDKDARKCLFDMINDLPTIFEVVTGAAKKLTEEKFSVSNDNNNKSKSNVMDVEEFRETVTLVLYYPRTMEEVFCDFKGRRAGMIKALTIDLEEFYQQCNPENENLCLYGFPGEQWEVNLPAEKLPPELPQPTVGINFARDAMQEKDWLSLVAKHSDVWLLSVAFYFGARLLFNKAERECLFNMINDLPTISEVVKGVSKKQTKEKSSISNSKEDEELGDALCGACGENNGADEFWICCDICEKWFQKCVNITPAREEHVKQQYKCPSCSIKIALP
ncbi:alfin-like 3 [Hibiscus trionum]|uniref:PHD finger protein ALFIN-LIKE n=1 Tax=Hibiscus trionum TaxID=183268 RepID=A0A9W7JI47_HIBTR|nr:alfin-like 3 [Hibiscus trionum]